MSCVWTVDRMLVKPVEDGRPDVVTTVYWSCTATDSGKTAQQSGNMGFEGAGSPFTPYAELTQEQVLDWVYARGLNKDQTEATVLSDLYLLVNPPVVEKQLPWA